MVDNRSNMVILVLYLNILVYFCLCSLRFKFFLISGISCLTLEVGFATDSTLLFSGSHLSHTTTYFVFAPDLTWYLMKCYPYKVEIFSGASIDKTIKSIRFFRTWCLLKVIFSLVFVAYNILESRNVFNVCGAHFNVGCSGPWGMVAACVALSVIFVFGTPSELFSTFLATVRKSKIGPVFLEQFICEQLWTLELLLWWSREQAAVLTERRSCPIRT